MIKFGLAGTTNNSLRVAKALEKFGKFQLEFVLTPSPKIIGKNKVITQNPVHQHATNFGIRSFLIDEKIDQHLRSTISEAYPKIELLLVIDFGYFVPEWLINLSGLAVNIHPSKLPEWRGSSPGQFVILSGASNSAVSAIKVGNLLDQGDIVWQEDFAINQNWTQTDYYDHSFLLAEKNFPATLNEYLMSNDKQTLELKQSLASPTPLARKLTREDGFVEWEKVKKLTEWHNWHQPENILKKLSFGNICANLTTAQELTRAVRALNPWPGVWTQVPTNKGNKRLKILSASVDIANDKQNTQRLLLGTVVLEGNPPTMFEKIMQLIRK